MSSISSFSTTRRVKSSKSAHRRTPSYESAAKHPTTPPSSHGPSSRHLSSPRAQRPVSTSVSEEASHTLKASKRLAEEDFSLRPVDDGRVEPDLRPTPHHPTHSIDAQLNEVRCLQWRDLAQADTTESTVKALTRRESSNAFDVCTLPDSFDQESEALPEDSGLIYEDASSHGDSNPWVIDNSIGNLLFQMFQNPGEEIIFSYCELSSLATVVYRY